MKRHQHITKLQSEFIKEKKVIDLKLDEASFLDANNIYSMSSYMYNYVTLAFIYAKDDNIGHSVTYDIKGCTYA